MDPDLAIVVVNHNTGDYLARCIASIASSAGELGTEIVVVDNASSDGSAERASPAGGRPRGGVGKGAPGAPPGGGWGGDGPNPRRLSPPAAPPRAPARGGTGPR